MTSKTHPVLKELLEMKCSDERAAPVAFAVYMDLAEVKATWDLHCNFSAEWDLIYITGRENGPDAELSIYIPFSASRSISPAWLQNVQKSLPVKASCLTMAFKDADSTIVYYQVSEGLVPPDSPEAVQSKKSSEEKKKLLHTELWRKRNQVYQHAKDEAIAKEGLQYGCDDAS